MPWKEEDNPVSGMIARNPGLVAPVLELADQMQLGQMTPAAYREGIERAQGRFNRLYGRLTDMLLAGRDLEDYRDGLMESLTDTFNILQYGLDELLLYKVGEDRAPIRMGRLLLEKGEQEYLALMEILQGDAPGSEKERTTNLWAQVIGEAEKASKKETTHEEWVETLAWVEWAVRAHMEGTYRDFQRALGVLRHNPDKPEEARHKVMLSLHRLKEFLGLSV